MQDNGPRLKLIETAERLFAERGLEAVSLREINRAAGQRNTAAIHYHFGSKLALVEAILSMRMRTLSERRRELMDALGPEPLLPDLIHALVQPLAEHAEMGGETHYVKFLAQIYSDPRVDIVQLIRGRHDRGMQRVLSLVVALLPDVPRDILEQRLVLQTAHMIYALADREQLSAMQFDHTRDMDTAVFVSDLVDTIAGALSAPVSQRTRDLMAACVSR